MKIRNGFVSNSSSSSYLIAFNKGDGHTVTDAFSNNDSYDGTYIEALGYKEVVKELRIIYGLYDNNSGHSDMTWLASFYNMVSKIAKQLNSNKDVALVQVSHHDEDANDKIGTLVVIENFGG